MVKRYLIGVYGEHEHPNGDFVHWQDYQAICAELEQASKDAAFFRQQFDDQVESREAAERLAGARVNTGCKDRNGEQIYLGDKVRYHLEGTHTKPEYWNPEYEVIFVPPAFTLKHIGGGKDGGSHHFKLSCGGGNGDLEIIERGPYHAALAEPAGEVEQVATGDPLDGMEDRVSAYLAATPPDASAIREAAEMARACLAGLVSAGHNYPPPDPEQIETAFWTLDKALAGAKP